jgi:hypothetical protein
MKCSLPHMASLLFVMKMMVWHFVNDPPMVINALLILLPSKRCRDVSATSSICSRVETSQDMAVSFPWVSHVDFSRY